MPVAIDYLLSKIKWTKATCIFDPTTSLLDQKPSVPTTLAEQGAAAAPTDEDLKAERLLQESSAPSDDLNTSNTTSTDCAQEECHSDVFKV